MTVAGPYLEHVTLFGLRTPSKFSQYMDPHPCLYVCKTMPNCTERVINRNKKKTRSWEGDGMRGNRSSWNKIIEDDMKWIKIHKSFNK